MISVIIRNYNNQNFLGRAIRSCLNQSAKAEVIVVDDASTDKSSEVIDSFGEKVVSIKLNKNVGVAEAANMGIRNALGRFVILVDSDDYINENTLLFMREILDKNHDIGFVYGDLIRVDKEENVIERINLDTPEKIFRHGAGIMFRKSYMETLGLYDRNFKNAEDHELISRYIKNFDGYHLRLPLYRYTKHENNITNNEEERKQWEKTILN
jgi:glycosyltransferase involved in cell wall biosynthesis